MDPLWWVLIFVGVFILLMIASKKFGFKFPLFLGVLAGFMSIIFRVITPASTSTPEEQISAK
jgi:hypothetical protein